MRTVFKNCHHASLFQSSRGLLLDPNAISMDIIVLNDSVVANVFMNWLELRNLVDVDSSYCNKKKRLLLLQFFSKPFFVLKSNFTDRSLLWFKTRRIKLSYVTVNGGDLDCFLSGNDASNKTSDSVTNKTVKLSLMNPKTSTSSTVIEFINTCSSLTYLYCHNVDGITDKSIESIKPEILKNLREITLLRNSSHLTTKVLHYIADRCTALTHLTFTINLYLEVDVLKAVEKMKCLEHINIIVHQMSLDQLLLTLRHNCCMLRSCEISNCINFSTDVLLSFMSGCQHLKYFNLNKNTTQTKHIRYTVRDSGKSIVVANFTSDATQVLFERMNGFTSIVLYDIGLALSTDLLMLVIKQNPGLLELEIAFCEAEFSALCIDSLLSECLELHTLKLQACDSIRNEDFQRIFAQPVAAAPKAHIKKLFIGMHEEIDLATVLNIVVCNADSLRQLCVFNCALVTQIDIENAVQAMEYKLCCDKFDLL